MPSKFVTTKRYKAVVWKCNRCKSQWAGWLDSRYKNEAFRVCPNCDSQNISIRDMTEKEMKERGFE